MSGELKGQPVDRSAATHRILVAVLWVMLAGCSQPEPPPATGVAPVVDVEAGKGVAAACTSCHRLDGKSTGPEVPHLAAQRFDYLLFALRAYKTKERGSATMQDVVARLDEADLINVAGYYASLPPIEPAGVAPAPVISKPAAGLSAAVAAGKAASAGCAGCHGADGNATTAGMPRLAAQDAQYLAAALKAYRDGSRSHAAMQALVATLRDADIENLAAFYSVQAPRVPKLRAALSLQEWVERCNRCHDPRVENPLIAFPKIKGQPAGYIAKALKAYRAEDGARVSSMMHAMAASLSDAEIEAIAAYYARQRPE